MNNINNAIRRDKGPRPTPRNLEWGTVEKMWLTTGANNLNQNDIPPEFRDADAKLQEMQTVISVLIRRGRAHQKSILAVTQASSALGAHLASVGVALGELDLVGKLLSNYSDALLATIVGHADLLESKYCIPLEGFLNETVNRARESKKVWEAAKKDANTGFKKIEETYNSADSSDPLKVFVTQYNVQLLHQKEVAKFEETADLLCDTSWMRDFKFLSYQVLLMVDLCESLFCRYGILHKLKEFEAHFQDELTKMRLLAEKRNKDTEDGWQKYQIDLHESRYDNLVEILSQPDLALLNSLLIVCAGEQDIVLTWIVKIMDAYRKVMPLIKQGITNEVEATKEAATLFRGNSTATKLMTSTTKLLGQQYLLIIKPVLEEIRQTTQSFEIDNTKTQPGEDVEQNRQMLTDMCQKVLDTILDGLDQCPGQFREMANHLHFEVGKKFPGPGKRNAVGGFLFLRFFCPAISAPDSQKIFESGSIPPNARRGFVLVGKVLQNLASGMKFGKKEAFMIDFNGFIEKNLPRVEEFLDTIATLPPKLKPFNLCQPAEAKGSTLPELHKKLVQNMELIIKSLKSYKQNALIFPFIEVLSDLGPLEGVQVIPAPKAEKKSGKLSQLPQLPFSKGDS